MFSTDSIAGFILRRIVMAIPLVIAIICATFLLVHLAPGDPIALLSGDVAPSEEQLEALYQRYALDQPLFVQLLNYLWSVLQGDFGVSFVNEVPVATLIAERIGATLLLMLPALLLFTALGVACGVYVSRRPYSVADNTATILSVIGYSIPIFWLGQLLLLVFALWFRWFPTGGMVSLRENYQGFDHVIDVATHLVLPTIVLGTRYFAVNLRLSRASMIEVLGNDYITSVRARGLPPKVVNAHALRNAILPVVTLLGVHFGDILMGAVLTEFVFGWPGLGRLLYDAIFMRDYPVLMGMFIITAVSTVLANVVTDIVYGIVDPRVRSN